MLNCPYFRILYRRNIDIIERGVILSRLVRISGSASPRADRTVRFPDALDGRAPIRTSPDEIRAA